MIKKERKVSAIRHGTVIDHIPPAYTFKILSMLNISSELVTVGNNLTSKSMGSKGVIKIAEKELTQEELNKIAIFAPEAKVSIIRNYKVAKKHGVTVPKTVEGIVQCFNTNCITRHQPVKTKFHLVQTKPIKLKCHHCEKTFDKEQISLI